MSRDELDAEFGHRPAELGRRAAPAELFFERLAVRRPKDAVAVAIDGVGDAHLAADIAQQAEIAAGVFAFVEAGARHLAGGVVDDGEEREVRTATLQPVVQARVYL